jgi:hypothetical protein
MERHDVQEVEGTPPLTVSHEARSVSVLGTRQVISIVIRKPHCLVNVESRKPMRQHLDPAPSQFCLTTEAPKSRPITRATRVWCPSYTTPYYFSKDAVGLQPRITAP